jgi:hypothetical protein
VQRDYVIKYDASSARQAAIDIGALAAALSAMTQAAQAAGANLANLHAQFGNIPTQATSATASVQSFVTTAMLLSEARKAVGAMGDVFKESRQYAHEVAEEAAKLLDKLRELANLRKQDTGKTATEFVGQMERTGATKAELEAADAEYEGAVDASRAKFKASGGKLGMDPNRKDIAEGLEDEAVKFGVRTGMDMPTAGRMAGLLGMYHKVDSVDAGANILGQIGHHLNVEGVGKVATLAKPFLSLAGEMVDEGDSGRFHSLADMSAAFSVATRRFSSGAAAATGMKQANRLLRKASTSDDPELKKFGVTTEDDWITGMEKMAPALLSPTADIFLKKHQIGKNDAERMATVRLARMLDEMKIAMEDPAAKATGAGTIAANADFLAHDPAGVERMNNMHKEAAVVRKGIKEMPYNSALKGAEGDLTDSGGVDTDQTRASDALYDFLGLGPYLGFKSSRDQRLASRAEEKLKAKAKAAGIVNPDKYAPAMEGSRGNETLLESIFDFSGGGLAGRFYRQFTSGGSPEEQRRQQFGELAKAVQAAEMQMKAAEKIDKAADKMAAGRGAGAGPPVFVGGGVGVGPGRGGGNW